MTEKLSSERIDELKSALKIPSPRYPYFNKLIVDGIDVHECKTMESITGEEFRQIKGLIGEYFISNYGRVKSNEKILDIYYEGKYLDISMVYIPQNSSYSIHRLIMETFLPFEGMDKFHVHHINNNALDTTINNLMWVSPEDHSQIHAEYNVIIAEISHAIYQNNVIDLIFYFNNCEKEVIGDEILKAFPNTYRDIIIENVYKLIRLNVIYELGDEKGTRFSSRKFMNSRKWLTIAST